MASTLISVPLRGSRGSGICHMTELSLVTRGHLSHTTIMAHQMPPDSDSTEDVSNCNLLAYDRLMTFIVLLQLRRPRRSDRLHWK